MTKYAITKSDHPFWSDKKNNKFAKIMPRFLNLRYDYRNANHLDVDELKADRVVVSATVYGLTILKLTFFRPYFNIKEIE